MRVGVVGINHKLADLKLREQLAKACQKRFGALQSVHGDHHFILLSTCNRTEVYFSSEDLTLTHTYLLSILRHDVLEEFDHKLYSYFGVDCFSHLVRVTAGLDSAVLAETEIQGQVKGAYELAVDYHSVPKDLHFLFQKSLGIAKKIRTEFDLGRGIPTLEQAILNLGRYFFKDQIKDKSILFIGASAINTKILDYFKRKGLTNLTVCNRSFLSAQNLAHQFNLKVLDWTSLSQWRNYDWIIVGTKSSDYLIKKEDAFQSLTSQLMIDLCVPRNIDPKLGFLPSINLINIDEINRLLANRNQNIKHTLTQAELMIASLTQSHTYRYLAKEQSKITVLAITA